ncbi:hypothetical protein HA402_011268 [Bradysia odoriphaga]|nr:hypothetical protein HA402_011268 [Bradysia odoriphaga]
MAWSLADLAILELRAVSVPLYATNTPAQAAFIINDADIRILFVGEQQQLDAAIALRGVCPQLTHIIVFDTAADLRGCEIAQHLHHFERLADIERFDALRQQRIAERDLQDLFTLIYTSGTTGEPKGVMLDYRNMAAQLQLHDDRLTVTADDVSLSFLPLSHVFERAWSFFIMHTGAQNVYLPNTDWGRETVGQVVRSFSPLADKLVLSKLRGILGGRVRFLPAAGAKLDDNVILFFQAMGVNIKYGYGMTETCATVSCWEENSFRFGSIGKPLPGVEVRIGDENEIQVRGPIVMRGYFNKPLETADSFTADGWLKTGDAGMIDDGGNLFITERLKGSDEDFRRQIHCATDAGSFESLEEYAKSVNLKYQDRLELLRNGHIIDMFEKRLREMQKELALFEQVKKFTLLPAAFSMELGELTPTLKLRRKVILQRYQHEIESMYQEK